MGHRDRWRTAALIAAAAGLVVQPVAAVAGLAVAWSLSTRERAPLPVGPALAAAGVLGLVALMGSSTPATWLLAMGILALGPVASLWSSLARPRDVEAIALGLAGGVAAHLVYAVGVAQPLPIAGMTAHPNVLGALGAMALPVLVATARGSGVVGWLARAGVLAALGAVALAGSRGAVVAGLVAVAWWVVLVARKAPGGGAPRDRGPRAGAPRRAGARTLLLFGALACAVVAAWVLVRQPTWPEALGATGRTTLWGVAIEGIVERPVFGHGVLAWARVAPVIEPSIEPARFPHAHSGYLELALSFGLVGASAVLAFFVALYRALGRAHGWGAAARATVVAFAIVNLGDSFVVDARFLGIVVLVSGAAWARSADALTPPAPTPPPPTA